jgi:hypothetical protein
MGRAFGFIMLIAVVGAGGYIYTRQATSVTGDGSAPQTAVDVTAARNDLLALANAERRYFASNGKYATLEELRGNGDIASIPTRPNFAYSVQTTDTSFKITATYSGPDPKAPKHITVDETMTITTD